MKKIFTLLVVLMAIAMGAQAGIELEGITILEEGGEPYYVHVPFHNFDNNYQGYLWGKTKESGGKKHMGKFTLNLATIYGSPAQVSESDLQDPNYWETVFKSMTYEMAGKEMVLDDNTDEIEIFDVALLSGLFKNYNELETVSLNYGGDCTIPSELFRNNNSGTHSGGNTKFSTLNCNVGGTLTIEDNVFPSGGCMGNLKIMCTSESVAKKWNDYKAANSAQNYNYKVYLNEEEYNETSSVGGVAAEGAKLTGKCYNAAGQQVGADFNGLTIQDGKKVIR